VKQRAGIKSLNHDPRRECGRASAAFPSLPVHQTDVFWTGASRHLECRRTTRSQTVGRGERSTNGSLWAVQRELSRAIGEAENRSERTYRRRPQGGHIRAFAVWRLTLGASASIRSRRLRPTTLVTALSQKASLGGRGGGKPRRFPRCPTNGCFAPHELVAGA